MAGVIYLNQRFEVFAFHPFYGSEDPDLKVMTWNVHCPNGSDSVRQHLLAEVILQEDADFVLLNEFYQDSCLVLDSLLKEIYPYTEEYQSHRFCGDIFYSKYELIKSGHPVLRQLECFRTKEGKRNFPDSLRGKSIQAIRATVKLGSDSVDIFGCHWASNSIKGHYQIVPQNSVKNGILERYEYAQKKRNFQAKWTKELNVESCNPVIVMGDFNDFSSSSPLGTLSSCGLKDAWWEGGFGYGSTFHSGWMKLRIDHILFRPMEENGAKGFELVNVKVVDSNLSDHNPMVASFKIKREED